MAIATTEPKPTKDVKDKKIKLYNPLALAIAGGKILDDEEQGPLDTDVDIDDPLYDPRLSRDLDAETVANINAFGVLTPVKVTMRDGVPFVVFGKRRVRSARRINRVRVATGQPLVEVEATVEPSKDERRLMGVLFAENAVRQDDGFVDTVANIRRYMERGVSLEDAAITFGQPLTRAKAWLDFDDQAIDVLRELVHRGVMSISAGIEIVRAGNPDAQRVALAELFADLGLVDQPEPPSSEPGSDPMPAGPSVQAKIEQAKARIDARAKGGGKATKIDVRAARSAAKKVRAPSKNEGVGDKRTLVRLLQELRGLGHPKANDRTIAFWEGAENMLTLIIGGDEADETDKRLVEVLKDVRAAMKKKGGTK